MGEFFFSASFCQWVEGLETMTKTEPIETPKIPSKGIFTVIWPTQTSHLWRIFTYAGTLPNTPNVGISYNIPYIE